MKVKKVFNNNILLAEDEQMLETVLMGKGIGFAMKPGEDVYKRQVLSGC